MELIKSKPTIEGAGVRLHRVFGYNEVPSFDPFLLLDDFSSRNADDYIAGFPWHPHRGIETVTYIIKGAVEHGDSMGNKGVIKSDNVQWMTAGSGIIHQEMPKRSEIMQGFQLWVNLPKKQKMMDPRYQEIKEIPLVEDDARIKIIAGRYNSVKGPVKDIVADPTYFDIEIKERFNLPIRNNYTNMVYVFEGKGTINGIKIRAGQLLTINDELVAESKMRFLFISGKPIKEPVAWGGPIVMNTNEELRIAFDEFDKGTFIKNNWKGYYSR